MSHTTKDSEYRSGKALKHDDVLVEMNIAQSERFFLPIH